MRILTWNCRRARKSHPLWQYFLELSPDIALLQEVTSLPVEVTDRYDVRLVHPPTKSGRPQMFQSAVLVRGHIGDPVPLTSSITWVNRELTHFTACLMAYRVKIDGWPDLTAVCVYSPAWPVAKDRLRAEDLSSVKLTQNPDVWVTDLLVAALKEKIGILPSEWIIAGDFNACESFDSWKGGPRGNREWLDRMTSLGLTECLRHSQGALTPTFRRPGKTEPKAQIDHAFVSSGLALRLTQCRAGDVTQIFDQNWSDHLPIICDISAPEPEH